MADIIVIGGGAAGMLAGIAAAGKGHKVSIYEKNEKLGKKLFITGKGRCNVTNDCDMEDLLNHVVTNTKFLYSSFYGFNNYDMMDLLEKAGCPLKTERGGRVFPVSDKSSDVISALSGRLKELGADVILHEEVGGLWLEADSLKGIILKKNQKKVPADAVIIATGGLSYPTTGSTGDGYKFAKRAGHTVTELLPALVPFEVKEQALVKELQGLALKNIRAAVKKRNKVLYEEFGEMLFTHFGVSGPVLLSASSFAAKSLYKGESLTLSLDLKPALTEEQLDARLLRDFEEVSNKQFKNALIHLYPGKLVPVMVERSGISPEKKVNEITREERQRIIKLTKDFTLTITGLREFKEAIITQGGIAVGEVNPSTMESKKLPGLYFAGEVLDLDAVTGGFNLQIAWSTAWAAGSSIM